MMKFRSLLTVLITATALLLPLAAQSAPAETAPGREVAFQPIPSGEYKIDPAHSIIGFAIRHLDISWVEGRFKDFEGTIHYDADDMANSSAQFTAQVESIDTGIAPRDEHLRSGDFFEVETYPELTFTSTCIEQTGDGEYLMEGDLTIKGVTERVSFPFTLTGAITDPWGNTRFGAEASTTIDRRDFGITFGNQLPSGALDVGHEVTINLQLEASKPGPEAE